MSTRFCLDLSLLPPPVTGPLERPVLPEDAQMFCPRLDFLVRPIGSAADITAEPAADTSVESDSPAYQFFIDELGSRYGW